MNRYWLRCLLICIAAFLLVSIFGIAILAIMAGRDSLAAGLISTVGALIAATVAWSSVQRQLRRQDTTDEKEQNRLRRRSYVAVFAQLVAYRDETFAVLHGQSDVGKDSPDQIANIPELPSSFHDFELLGYLDQSDIHDVYRIATMVQNTRTMVSSRGANKSVDRRKTLRDTNAARIIISTDEVLKKIRSKSGLDYPILTPTNMDRIRAIAGLNRPS